MDLLKPLELENDALDWTGRYRNADVWDVLNAARDGDVDKLQSLITREQSIVHAQFWYVSPLHFAVREGHLPAVKLLVENGADLTSQTLYGGETFLQVAMDRGREEVATYLRKVFKEQIASDGTSHEIHHAAAEGDIETIAGILQKDHSQINVGDPMGRRPLHYAIENQHSELINFLLANGADPDALGFSSDNRLGGYGFRAVASALWYHPYWRQRNDYTTARRLLENGAEYSMTIAAALGDEDRVRELLSQDRNSANHQEPGGKRAISAAAERNHRNIVKRLLDAGADPNLREGPNCPRGFALWAASHLGFRDIAEMLLEAGADPNAPVESSGNPTESAADSEMRSLLYLYGGRVSLSSHFHQGNIDTIAALLAMAPEIFDEIAATEGFTHCVSSAHGDIVKLLLAHGIRVPSQVTYCQTYLWQNLDLTRLLLENGMDPNLPNWQQIRPLHHMGRRGEVDGARLFIEFGADPGQIDEEYRTTPLGWAARCGQSGYAQFLLERFPEWKIHHPPEMPEWSQPMQWARRRNHAEIIKLLSTAFPQNTSRDAS